VSRYTVTILEQALASLQRLQRRERQVLLVRIGALADDPRPAGALAVQGHPGMLRIRSGNYRVLYVVRDRELLVLVVRVGDRKHVYDRLAGVDVGGPLPGS
jgi:mRNA interferase RelE/StbE